MKSVALLTAGLGSRGFEDAARRILCQSSDLYNFSAVFMLSVENLAEYCPSTLLRYESILLPGVKGYGYWSWKPEFVYRVARGDFGRFDQIVWVDSGCEINSNFFSRSVFKSRLAHSYKYGAWFHALHSSDEMYTKIEVVRNFPELDIKVLRRPQIQANYFHIAVSRTLDILERWFLLASGGVQYLDLNTTQDQSGEFVEHRSDQSLLSLLSKSAGLSHSRINLPTGRSFSSSMRSSIEPIWISRNRSGLSVIPKWVSRIP